MIILGHDPTVRRSRKAGLMLAPERRRHIFGGMLDWISGGSGGDVGQALDTATNAGSTAADTAANVANTASGWTDVASTAANSAANSGILNTLWGGISNMLGFGGGTGSAVTDPYDLGGMAKGAADTATNTANYPISTASDMAGLSKPDALSAVLGSTATGAAPIAGGVNKTALALAALAALGSALSKPKQGSWSTPGPSSSAANLGPYQNSALNTAVPGRAATYATPANAALPSGALNNYWTYGGPERTYFTGNSLANYGFAHGGALSLAHGGHEFSTEHGTNYVRGEGDGISDSVPARLSDGEYVLTASDVARIGRGSNEAGAKKLDEFREHLAHEAGQKKFIPAKVGGALKHLAAGA